VLVRFLPRHQWEDKLRRMGFRPAEGLTKLNTAEWWIGPRGPFTIPVEKDGSCDFWRLQRLSNWHVIALADFEENDEF